MRWALASVILALSVLGASGTAHANEIDDLVLPGAPKSAEDRSPVELDARIYVPVSTPAPAVVLAHGFGGSKESVTEEAQLLSDRGFVVLTYSARGFGDSTGLISMNSPEFEVADASALIDFLATQETVIQDSKGDPRVGFAGGSYGGALALLAAGYDERVDAVSADITWNNLQDSLFGQSIVGSNQVGVFKQLWSGVFFSAGLTTPDDRVTTCGRFAPQWCAAYSSAAAEGVLTDEAAALMFASSPASITQNIAVPTLLGGGLADSLFPLAQVNANAEQIAAAHPEVPLKVVWHAGGHDGGIPETQRLRELSTEWFSTYLMGEGEVDNDFEVSYTERSAFSDRQAGTVNVLTHPSYPGVNGTEDRVIDFIGEAQEVLAPAGGVPAALSSLPGAGQLASLAGSFLANQLPNQSATFTSQPLSEALDVLGSARARLEVSSNQPQTDVTLFASLRVRGASGISELPAGLVAPLRIDSISAEPTEIDIALPAIATRVAAGEQLELVITTTDQAYRLPAGPAVYRIAISEPKITVPTAQLTPQNPGAPAWLIPLIGLGVIVVAGLTAVLLLPRRRGHRTRSELANIPIVVENVSKRFRSGVQAVDGVSFTVPKGVVLGLLGPNGAGKTTTMRMLMGLIRPTSGQIYVNGDQVWPGASTLANIGCFIEGPGFLPHLSGRENLRLYWAASGRQSEDPHLDEVLEIAGLGSAVDRKVKTYSQGMRQRLGIAQAMLGMPSILVLDEPTNGLDPPQILEMRQVLKEYVKSGRTVVISSHLLSEVEQTCTDVVVMHHGTVLAQGTVSELLREHRGKNLEDVFMEIVGEGHEVVTA